MIRELKGKWRPFSNFWSCFIHYEGQIYPSVENAYQALKMKNEEDRFLFLHCKASEAKQLGRIHPMRDDWLEFKDSYGPFIEMYKSDIGIQNRIIIMYELVFQKFEKDFYLKYLLLSTGEEEIQEGNYWGDTFWGTVNGIGENHLGKILMQVRKELRLASNTKELA